MRHFSFWMLIVIVLGSFGLFMGCGGTPDKGEPQGIMAKMPEWISTESNTYTDEDGSHVIYAVGVAAAGKNPAMRWDAAKTNGIANISRTLNTHVRTMFTAYAREAGDFYDEATQSSIQNNENVTRTLSESFVSGAICIEKYLTDDMKEAYVLMRLDLDNKMLQTMSDRAKTAIRENFAAKVKAHTEEALGKMDEAAAALKAELTGTTQPLPASLSK